MQPLSPQPKHSSGIHQGIGSSDAWRAGPSYPSAQNDDGAGNANLPGGAPGETAIANSLFAEALDGALTLVRAEGGEVATLDRTRQVLVVRARSTRPRIPTPGRMGTPGQSSQPLQPSLGASGASVSGISGISGTYSQHPSGIRDASPLGPRSSIPPDGANDIDEQSTVLLPAAPGARSFHPGEGLMGLAWQRGEPVVLSGDDYRAQTRPGHAGYDASWHLAVPIFRPASLATTHPSTEIIGVIAVYSREPLWSFSARDAELLALHADRVGRAIAAADLLRQNQRQSDLLDVLRGVGSDAAPGNTLFLRLRDLVRHLVDASSFALVLYHPQNDAVSLDHVERDGRLIAPAYVAAASLPAWWRAVQSGQVVRVSSAEERAAHPEFTQFGFGGEQPIQSLLAAPLTLGTTLLGALVAGSAHPDAYALEHARVFETVARSTAILIENARLAGETQRALAESRAKARQLAVLNNAVLTLNASLDMDETVQALARQASQFTTAECCLVFLHDTESKSWVVRAAHAQSARSEELLLGAKIPQDWRAINSLLTREPFFFLDRLREEWSEPTPTGQLLAELRIESCVVFPIIHPDPANHSAEMRGMLLVYTPGQPHHFPPHEIGLLQGLATQAAYSISNAQNYRELGDALERQKMLDKLKDEFILTVSHEFRTPLTAIDGYVTLIGRHGHKLDQEKLNQFAGEIRQATSQLASMINMLADANRMTSQPLVLTVVPVNVHAAATMAIATQSPEAKARIQLEIADDLSVLADAERLSLVFSNLVSNAIKYAPEGTPCRLTARVERREVLAREGRAHTTDADAAEQWVVLGVRDQGPGISVEDQKKLFQKFVRLTHSLTTSVRGTGLGLWICHEYLNAMHGDIWVESAPAQGSHFLFCLPLASAQTSAP